MTVGLPSGSEPPLDGYLTDGEAVVYQRRPQFALWLAGRWPLALAMVVVVVVAARTTSSTVGWLAVVGLVAVIGEGCIELLQWCCTWYVLTSHRAMRFEGVIGKDCEWLSWSKITEVSIRRSFADRCVGTATIEIHAANSGSSFRALTDVAEPMVFAEIVAEQVNRRIRPPKD